MIDADDMSPVDIWCLFFHRWSKWYEIKRGRITWDGIATGHYITQECRCLRCGKVKLRTVEA